MPVVLSTWVVTNLGFERRLALLFFIRSRSLCYALPQLLERWVVIRVVDRGVVARGAPALTLINMLECDTSPRPGEIDRDFGTVCFPSSEVSSVEGALSIVIPQSSLRDALSYVRGSP